MELFTTALDLYGGVCCGLWSGELQGLIILYTLYMKECLPPAARRAAARVSKRQHRVACPPPPPFVPPTPLSGRPAPIAGQPAAPQLAISVLVAPPRHAKAEKIAPPHQKFVHPPPPVAGPYIHFRTPFLQSAGGGLCFDHDAKCNRDLISIGEEKRPRVPRCERPYGPAPLFVLVQQGKSLATMVIPDSRSYSVCTWHGAATTFVSGGLA
jgi:hypothetical protein